MNNMNPLYEEDFNMWIEEQASLLKSKKFENLDIENLAEEIDSMARRDKRTLKNQMIRLLMHLLKFKHQPEKQIDSHSWVRSIRESKSDINDILEDSPSLKEWLNINYGKFYSIARKDASSETELPIILFPVECPWTIEEVLGE